MEVDLYELARARPRTTDDPKVDAVTAEVIRGGMETVCFEMANYVSRTATTPILNQSNERNATILDARGRLAALSVGIPQFMLTSTLPVRFALDFLGADEFREGDVFVANDPYHGGGHLPDYNVFAPVFATDESRHPAHGADRLDPVPPRRHRRRRARRLQRHRHRRVGRGRALAGGQGGRPGRGAPRHPLHAAGQQPPARLPGRHPGPDRRRPARGAAPAGDHRPPRRAHRGGVGRLHDRLRRPPLPRGGRHLARRHLRGRLLGRPRPPRHPRHPPARGGHRRRRPPAGRLRRHRHPPGAPELVARSATPAGTPSPRSPP